MRHSTGRVLVLSTAIIFTLSACEDGQLFAPSSSSESASNETPSLFGSREARTETREVERPDVFSVTEQGLWDGRPSLGGIWVAHPDVAEPERVRIENTANGKVVNGALFRRERENPGPRIQVSSDAAGALDMLAGQPRELSLVVVREEAVEIAPILPPEGEVDAEPLIEPAETAEIEAATVDDIAMAEGVEATDVNVEADVAAPKPKRAGFFATLFGTGASQKEPIETEVIAGNGDVVTTSSAAAPDVETAALDPIAAASAAIDEAEATAAAPAPTNGLRNPFVQVGLFTNEENANAAAAGLREAGIVPSIAAGSNGTREFWRVIVGPMTTADEQALMLEQIRSLGYRDAFLTPS